MNAEAAKRYRARAPGSCTPYLSNHHDALLHLPPTHFVRASAVTRAADTNQQQDLGRLVRRNRPRRPFIAHNHANRIRTFHLAMAHHLPPGFTAIKDATTDNATVNLVGVVVSAPNKRQTRGTDSVLSFTIQDDFSSVSVGGCSSIGCRIFLPEYQMPKEISLEDIVILSEIQLSSWNSRLDCVNTIKTRFSMLVFPAQKIPVLALSEAYQAGSQTLIHTAVPAAKDPTPREQMAVIHLKYASSVAHQQVQQHAAATAIRAVSSNKLALIKDLESGKFYDIRVLVVSMYYLSDFVDLKVTDYTANKAMFYYADPEKEASYLVSDKSFRGPYGFLTLGVTLYHKNAAWARDNVAVGDYVFLRNVRIKISQNGKLEGTMFQNVVDQQQPDKYDIRRLTNSCEIQEIKNRREEYEKGRGTKSAFQNLKDVPAETTAKTTSEKKKAKRERQRAEKEAEQKELEEKARQWEVARSGVNAHSKVCPENVTTMLTRTVVAAHPEMKLSTISEILYNPHREMKTPDKYNTYTLPFVNCKYRCRVRVVDVYPPELEMFSHSMNDREWNKHPKKQNSNKERWEWGFVLLLEDAVIPPNTVSKKLRVVVNNDAAQHLLDMNATEYKILFTTIKF